MAETGIGISIEVIKAITKHCFDLCAVAKQYPEDAARIRLRLAFVLSRVPEWSNQITARIDDPGCALLVQNLHTALTNLTTCVEALGSIDQQKWRHKIKHFLNGKNLHTELLKAEEALDQSLHDLNHDNTSFIAQHIGSLKEEISSLQGTVDEILPTIIKAIYDILSGNHNNPKETLKDVIAAELEECYEENKDDDDGPNRKGPISPNTSNETIVESFEDDLSLLISNRSSITFSETCLGVGAFAKVFKGIFKDDDVAIKVIDIYRYYPNKDDMPEKVYQAEIERVRDEAIILKECSVHSHIVDVYGYSHTQQKGSKPLIIMELMHCSLHTLIHEDKDVDFSFRMRMKLLRDVAGALEFLHIQRYVHQDLKPSNILVDQQCTTAKLADFGVTERKGFNTTRTWRNTVLSTIMESSGNTAPGTRTYQAPELILGRTTEASREAEMYSFGVTSWECMSRKIPHNRNEDNITNLARHSTKLMLQFPLKSYLIDKGATLSSDEQLIFSVLEKVTYLCLSKFRPTRPNATQVLQYFDGDRQFNPDFLMVAPLSKWHNVPDNNNNPVVPMAKSSGDNFEDEIIIRSNLTNPSRSGMDENPHMLNIQNLSNTSATVQQTNNDQPLATQPASADMGLSNERGNSNDAQISQNQDDEINLAHKVAALIHLAQQNWKLVLCMVVVLVTGIVVVVLVVMLLQAPPDEPTKAPTQIDLSGPVPAAPLTPQPSPVKDSVTCFATPSILRMSIISYFNGDTSVQTTYGTKIGDWCVDNIEDFSEVFDFYNLIKFNEDISKWNTSSAKNMSRMFRNFDSFNGDLSSWDVSKVTDMSYMFWHASSFNGDLSSWDVSKVTDMSHMFDYALSFNGTLTSWDVSNVTDMSYMFWNATSFNADLSYWDVSKVTNMANMFYGANLFNGNISSWDVSKVTDMSNMFFRAYDFNGDLSWWDVSKVTDMTQMFWHAYDFKGNLSSWNVTEVTKMYGMFYNAFSFSGDLSLWAVSKVTDMYGMFWSASLFDSDLSSWDVSKVVNIYGMFYYAISFNKNLCSWGNRLDNNTNVYNMFSVTNCPSPSPPSFNNTPPGPFCYDC